MENITKKNMLLHSCCRPCSTTVIFELLKDYDLTIYYYNPNIYPTEEYLKRKAEQLRLIDELNSQNNANIKVIDAPYDPEIFEEAVELLQKEKEGGARCAVCFNIRLEKTAKEAKEKGFDVFATTLTVSPHKNAPLINKIGGELSKKYEIEYLVSDFKKKDGYKKSIEYSKEYNLYRQNYCGCKYSIWF